jgi:hypothetical protein
LALDAAALWLVAAITPTVPPATMTMATAAESTIFRVDQG